MNFRTTSLSLNLKVEETNMTMVYFGYKMHQFIKRILEVRHLKGVKKVQKYVDNKLKWHNHYGNQNEYTKRKSKYWTCKDSRDSDIEKSGNLRN